MKVDLDTEVAHAARRLSSDMEALCDAVMERMRDVLPEWMRDPTLFETSREFARESIEAELQWLRMGAMPETCPPVDAAAARQGAHAGVPLDVLLLGYRAGQAVQWRAWFRLMETDVADDEDRRKLIERGSDFFFDYADRLSRFVTQEFSDERDRMMRSREHRRVKLIRDLLEGAEVSAEDLGYDPSGNHIGVAALGPEVESGLAELADSTNRTLLTLVADEDLVLAWLGGREPAEPGWDRAAEQIARQRRLRMCFGDPAQGTTGFRRTHRQAIRAQRGLAPDRVGHIVLYEQVALEALAAVDENEARAFVARELRHLDADGKRDRLLRETLEAWFASGQNAAAAAARLDVHEQTVAARLRAVEERTGRPVTTRRAELETALRLREYLG